MGTRGPVPERAALRVLKGTAKPAENVAMGGSSGGTGRKAPAKLPKAPLRLEIEGRRLWRLLGREMLAAGTWSGDGSAVALSLLCQRYEDYIEARRVQQTEGMTHEGHRGVLTAHPAARQARDCATEIVALLRELGLTPAAKARLGLPELPEADTLDAILDDAR